MSPNRVGATPGPAARLWRGVQWLPPVILAAMLFGLLVWPGLAYDFSQKLRLSTLLGVVSAGPDIAAAGSYVAAVWSEGYNNNETTKEYGHIYLKSADLITGWEARTKVFAATADNWGKDPKLVFDPVDSSKVHMVWAQADSCAGGGNPLLCKWRAIQYTTCTLAGVDSCAVPTTVHSTTDSAGDYSTPDVAVDSAGNVHVVWRRSAPAPARLMYAMKPAAAGSFSAATDITGSDNGRNPAWVFGLGASTCAAHGCLHLVWDGGSTIEYRRDVNPGDGTWSSDVPKFWVAPAGYEDPSFPAIGAGQNNALYAVWAVQQTGVSPPRYALAFASSNIGATWNGGGDGLGIPDPGTFEPFKSAKGNNVSYLESLKPDVVVVGSGNSAYAHVVWHGAQSESSLYNVWYTYQTGITATSWFSPVVQVSDSSGDGGDPAIAVGTTLTETHVVYMQDADASDAEVWYTGSIGNRANDGNRDEGNFYLPIITRNSK